VSGQEKCADEEITPSSAGLVMSAMADETAWNSSRQGTHAWAVLLTSDVVPFDDESALVAAMSSEGSSPVTSMSTNTTSRTAMMEPTAISHHCWFGVTA
jgi:hypothetical protein